MSRCRLGPRPRLRLSCCRLGPRPRLSCCRLGPRPRLSRCRLGPRPQPRGWSITGQGRPAVGTESPVRRVRGAATRAALLSGGRSESECRRSRSRNDLGVRCDDRGRRCRGGRSVEPIPAILAEFETVRVLPAAAAAVHDVVASCAVLTESCPGGPDATRPCPAGQLSRLCRLCAHHRESGSRASMMNCTASQCATPKPRGPRARSCPVESLNWRKAMGW